MIKLLFQNPSLYAALVAMVVFSICCHEYMHARVALWQGDSTAADKGHLTLNPLVQMGILSLILCAVIGVAFGAVPVNPSRMRHRYSHALVAVAGPLTNLALFFVFALVGLGIFAAAAGRRFDPSPGILLCGIAASLNFSLFVLNMLPIPPLDGHTFFSWLFPRSPLTRMNQELKNGLMAVVFILVFVGFGRIQSLGMGLYLHCLRISASLLGLGE